MGKEYTPYDLQMTLPFLAESENRMNRVLNILRETLGKLKLDINENKPKQR